MRTIEKKRFLRKDDLLGWGMGILPIVGFALFTFLPMAVSVAMSFSSFGLDSYRLETMKLVGFDNYKYIFTDGKLWKATGQTLLYCLSIPFEIGLGLFFANLLRRKFTGRRALRVIFFMPNICSVVALAFVWRYMYSPSGYGLFNQIASLFGAGPFRWLGSETGFIPCIIAMTIWNVVGYDILLFQAALGNINRSLYEAAELDGAVGATTFFRITLPMVTPTVFYLLMMGLIGGMQSFARMDAMNTNPYAYGPRDSGLTLVAYMVRAKNAPTEYGGLGVAAASSLFIAFLTAAITIVNLKVSKRWVHYDD